MTPDIRALLDDMTRRLSGAGVASPRHDAEALLAHVAGASRTELLAGTVHMDEKAVRRLDALVERRAAREPLQHLTGVAGFRHLELVVGPGVFVPRPETELLAGAGVDEVRRLVAAGRDHPLVVDLCTGSGAIAAAVASEAPQARVVAVEVAESAVAFARRNAEPYGVEVRLGDMAHTVDDLAGRVDVVTANPPYIPMDAWESVEIEVRDHDPAEALWSGPDGLDDVRTVAEVSARLLVDGGLVLCEHADAQGESAPGVFAAMPAWEAVRDHRDLAGRPRFTAARRVRRGAGPAGTIGV